MKKARRGTLFFTDNFLTIGNSKTVNKALERLVAKEEITRVARGIYTRPKNFVPPPVNTPMRPLLPPFRINLE